MTIRTLLHDIASILEYIEGIPDVQSRKDLAIAYFEQVHAFKEYLIWYFTEVKGKFDPKPLANVEYDLPEEGVPAYSSIQKNMPRIKAIVNPLEPLTTRTRLKKMVYTSISMAEILILENTFDGTLEEMYPGIDWDELKSLLGVKDATV